MLSWFGGSGPDNATPNTNTDSPTESNTPTQPSSHSRTPSLTLSLPHVPRIHRHRRTHTNDSVASATSSTHSQTPTQSHPSSHRNSLVPTAAAATTSSGTPLSSIFADASGGDDGTMDVDAEEGNVLSHIISQLRPGADMSRVVLPTFILEPRSMLERITNFMCHPELLLPIPYIDDPVDRFVSVVKFYLSGWHLRPPGVRKPLNPILGEIHTCYWDFPDQTRGYYIAEQTSHHPPQSSYFYMVPDHHIRVDGSLKPRSRFLGNSVASMMEGIAILSLLNRGRDPAKGERYTLTQPNMYARNILFGKMKYELGDRSIVRCEELDLVAEIEFKTKGWVSGTYDAMGGQIKRESTGEVLYELSGLWSETLYLHDVAAGTKTEIFHAPSAVPNPPLARPVEEQDERMESQRLWKPTTDAVRARDHVAATEAKTAVEDRQRAEAAQRVADGVEWHPRLFRRVHGGPRGGVEEGEEDLEWILNAHIDARIDMPDPLPADTPAEDPSIEQQQPQGHNAKRASPALVERQTQQILAVYPILPGQKQAVSTIDPIPSHESLMARRGSAA